MFLMQSNTYNLTVVSINIVDAIQIKNLLVIIINIVDVPQALHWSNPLQ
jgi:hypothetical protein